MAGGDVEVARILGGDVEIRGAGDIFVGVVAADAFALVLGGLGDVGEEEVFAAVSTAEAERLSVIRDGDCRGATALFIFLVFSFVPSVSDSLAAGIGLAGDGDACRGVSFFFPCFGSSLLNSSAILGCGVGSEGLGVRPGVAGSSAAVVVD